MPPTNATAQRVHIVWLVLICAQLAAPLTAGLLPFECHYGLFGQLLAPGDLLFALAKPTTQCFDLPIEP